MRLHFVASLGIVAVAAACPSPVAAPCKGPQCDGGDVVVDSTPRFFAEPPFGIGFDCVTIGCDTTKTLTIENRGGGALALSSVRLSVTSSTDFTLTRADGAALPQPDLQVELGAGEQLELLVRYRPSDDELDEGAVEMEHYDGAVEYLESAPKTDEVPLTARAFGSPAASLPSEVLDFGYVAVGGARTLEVVVDNIGTESVLRVGPLHREDGTSAAFHAPSPRDWGERFANPGEAVRIPVTFAPTSANAFLGAVVLNTNDPLRPGVRVLVQGTAISEARLGVVEPAGDLVMSNVRLGETRNGRIVVRNLGGTPLDIGAAVDGAAAAAGFSVAPANVNQLMPLQTAQLDVTLVAALAGDVSGLVNLTTNDPSIPGGLGVVVRGTVDAPRLGMLPIAVDFGQIVQGWTAEPRQAALHNIGFGELEITSIAFEVGSSSQISVVDVPPLPIKLVPGGDPVVLTFVLTATNVGPANAVLLVASDDIDVAVKRLDIVGEVITCEQGCPIPNGTPDCSAGRCEIAGCFDDFHDADLAPGNGCECTEDVVGAVREDIGPACIGLDLGTLSDNDGGFNRVGTLHDSSDVDLYFIRMRDDTQFLNDDYGGEIVLVSAPPGLQVCANFQDNGSGCGGLPTNCSTSRVRGNGQSGIFGSSDNSEDVTVWVSWQPGATPTCGNYTVRFDADEDF